MPCFGRHRPTLHRRQLKKDRRSEEAFRTLCVCDGIHIHTFGGKKTEHAHCPDCVRRAMRPYLGNKQTFQALNGHQSVDIHAALPVPVWLSSHGHWPAAARTTQGMGVQCVAGLVGPVGQGRRGMGSPRRLPGLRGTAIGTSTGRTKHLPWATPSLGRRPFALRMFQRGVIIFPFRQSIKKKGNRLESEESILGRISFPFQIF